MLSYMIFQCTSSSFIFLMGTIKCLSMHKFECALVFPIRFCWVFFFSLSGGCVCVCVFLFFFFWKRGGGGGCLLVVIVVVVFNLYFGVVFFSPLTCYANGSFLIKFPRPLKEAALNCVRFHDGKPSPITGTMEYRGLEMKILLDFIMPLW